MRADSRLALLPLIATIVCFISSSHAFILSKHSPNHRKSCNYLYRRKRQVFLLEMSHKSSDNRIKKSAWWKAAVASMGILGATLTPATPTIAADTVKVGKCLLQSCQKELAACILNPSCLANVICLNSCNGRPDEAECEIKCGDTFENEVVGTFNKCAVSQKKCVPQKQDEGLYPVPPLSAQVKKFDTSIWNGRWYITAGLNKIFDTFDCQVHFFNSPYPGPSLNSVTLSFLLTLFHRREY